MSIWLGALLCWAGWHAPYFEMRLYGLGDRCKRCGLWLPRRGVDVR